MNNEKKEKSENVLQTNKNNINPKKDRKLVWYDARNLKSNKVVLPLIYNCSFEYLLITSSMYKKIKPPVKMKLIVEIGDDSEISEISPKDIIFSKKIELLKKVKNNGFKVAFFKQIDNEIDMDNAWKVGGEIDYLVVSFKDETNIPLELLIAKLQNQNTVLMKIVKDLTELKIVFGVMEIGCDGVIISNEDINEIKMIDNYIMQSHLSKLDLVRAEVIDVQHVGMGYRACIDTTDLMNTNEGMLIGSTSNGGILVSSETHFLPYMELRPFRVNAGAVHSYVWAPEGKTTYLTELKAGSKLLCVDVNGNAREVVVGRIKIELRPLLKIEVKAGDQTINVIVQDDWHIRIFGGNGEPRNASTIKIGDQLLSYICSSGRHVGIKIDEMIYEK